MDCSYCGKDMEDLDICPKCGMGKRIDFELFKANKKDFEILNLDKEERKKDFDDYEKNYLERLENKDNPNDDDNSTPEINNGYSPKIGKLPNSNNSKGLKIIAGIAFPIILGIIIGYTL